jgi:hypothetical protein
MKLIVLIALLALFCTPVTHADVTLTLGEPDYYGPVEIDEYYGEPRLIFREPIVLNQETRTGRPLYLHVPPGHAQDWKKHCKHYDACDQPAYFVENSWYQDTYVPTYREHHGNKGKDPGKGQGKDHGKDKN